MWADNHKKVSVRVRNTEHSLSDESNGYFVSHVPGVCEGDTYTFLVDDKGPFPDPASRFQPEGPHGPSQLIDPSKFAWTDEAWPGIKLANQVIYELHIGTFTPEGTWDWASKQLPQLADLGITVIEVMPVTDFAGTFGWGYDGVDLFSPTRNYGSPDDFRAFVDAAHTQGIGVILDVVYNHVGPRRKLPLDVFQEVFHHEHTTEWGEAINFYGDNSGHGPRILHCQCRLLDQGISLGWTSAGCHAIHFRPIRNSHSQGDHSRAHVEQPCRGMSLW